MALVNKIKLIIKTSIVTLMLVFICAINCYAAEYTLCNGKEFNRRVISFLNNGDKNMVYDYSITLFNKGNNPPDDPTYYVDVSEDKDGSVIVYKNENELCWYSDSFVKFPKDASFMFENFMNLRNCDLSEFLFLNGLSDTRYMFSNCRRLRKLTYGVTPPGKEYFDLSEVQGMFYNCQSIQSIDLSKFDFLHVENMMEMFARCFNLRNIYVSKKGWNLENLIYSKNIFTECHSLRTNNGRKAVDVSPDDYEKYLVPGSDSVEGFLKDNMITYSDYGESLETVRIEDRDYINVQHETTETYADEPEGNYGEEGEIGEGNGNESVESEIQTVEIPAAQIETTKPAIIETTEIETQIIEPETVEVKPTEKEHTIIEIEPPKGESKRGGIFEYDTDHSRFIIFALIISIIAILLLVGMVVYLYKEAKPKEKQGFHGEQEENQ